MTGTRPLPWLYLVSAVLTAAILAPVAAPGHLLYRDAVSTPRSFVTDSALGVGGLAPRAVPQDWFVALASSFVDGGFVVVTVLAAALVFAGVGYGRLALRLVPAAGRTGAVAASVVGVWNPYVAERLLQGHWALLTGYAALGWLVVAVCDLDREPRSAVRWLHLGGLFAAAGLTPTGSLLGLIVVLTASAVTGVRRIPGCIALWTSSALPWLVATIVGGATIGSDGSAGVRAFGLRSEPLLGPVGTALGLGGIWNADAVPASRTIGWAAIATGCLVGVVTLGSIALWRRRGGTEGSRRMLILALASLAAVAVAGIALGAVGPGRSALGWMVSTLPGGGLLRDSTKFLALAVPFVTVAAAGAAGTLRRHVPAGFAMIAVALLVVAPLPDLAWGVGGRMSTVHYPDEWSAVAALVPSDAGAVAVWPPGTVRRYPFADAPSLDPAPRMLRAPVVESGELRVDGEVIDPGSPRATDTEVALRAGDTAALARSGVGWVLVEHTATGGTPPPAAVAGQAPVFESTSLTLYRIEGAATPHASGFARAAAWAAHLAWAALLVGGLGAGVGRRVVSGVGARRRGRSAGRPPRTP